jgi:hypothetical protein
MIRILENLEPVRFDEDTYLYRELDEFNIVLFFDKGEYKIGYSINNNE